MRRSLVATSLLLLAGPLACKEQSAGGPASSPSGGAAPAVPEPRPAAPRREPQIVWRDLHALWYRDEAGKPRLYGTTRVSATVTVNPAQEVRVGVLEEYAGATGTQWRTSVWLASFLASQALGRELTDHQFAISVGGFIDGPSAGALMATGFMAAMNGDPLLPDRTVTGALAPDGSVVVVGGIPEKIHAAKEMKMTVVGIPAGQAVSAGADGKTVDVVALGRSLGVRVVELRDLHDAYELMTGKKIERPTPLPPERMRLAAGASRALAERVRDLVRKSAADAALVAGHPTPGVARLLRRAARAREEAESFLARDDVAAAFMRASRAASFAKAAVRVASLGGDPKLEAAAGSLEQTAARIEATQRALASAAANGRPLALLEAASATVRAQGFLEVARALLTAATARAVGSGFGARAIQALRASGKAILPAIYLGYADLAEQRARDALAAAGASSAPLRFDPAALVRAARSFVSAASGNVEYIDALLLSEVAQQQKRPIEDVRAAFGLNERSYLLAAQLAQMAVTETAGKRSLEADLLRLAAAASSYVDSAVVITKYYSLDAELPSGPAKARIPEPPGLAPLLARAEVGARESAALAAARLGVVPAEAQFHYDAALDLARGDVRLKLRALGEFWRSSVTSRLAAMVLRR